LLEGSDVVSDGVFGVVGDIWSRRVLITGGTLAAGLGLLLMGIAPDYIVLLAGVILHGLAGGPFVGLSEASLIDNSPGKQEAMMAWWTIVGDSGFLVTSLMVSAAYTLSISWRPLFLLGAALFLLYALWLAALRFPRPAASTEEHGKATLSSHLVAIKAAVLNLNLLRWALILPLLDVPLQAFVVLYFHDVVGLSASLASLTLLIAIISAPVGRVSLPFLLRYVRGIRLLRAGVWLGVASLILFLINTLCYAEIYIVSNLQYCSVKLVPPCSGTGICYTAREIGSSAECNIAAFADHQPFTSAGGCCGYSGWLRLGFGGAVGGTGGGGWAVVS
jgi:MFS family permease